MGIKALGYVVIETTYPDQWDRYLLDIVGAMRGRGAPGDVAFYRIDDRPFRFWVQRGEREGLVAAAYEVSDTIELTSLRNAICETGRIVEDGSAEEAHARGVTAFFRTNDPAGNGLEFFCGGGGGEGGVAEAPFISPVGVKGFVTGDMGMGHAVFAAPNFQESHDFYRNIGFRDSDVARYHFSDDPEDPGLGFAFMHAENGRHHSLAIGDIPQSGHGCIHLMLEMADQADVGKCHDRMRAAKIKQSASLGRHVNDQTFGFYMQTPSGFDLEIGCDPIVIDPSSWTATSHSRPSEWGHYWAWQAAMENQQ